MHSLIRVQIHNKIVFRKGMNPSFISKEERLGSFALLRRSVKNKENSVFESDLLRLKIDMEPHPGERFA